MKKTFSKQEAKERIEKFFVDVKNKSPEEIRKIKRTSMQYKIPLDKNKKLFCKKCYSPYKFPKIRIKNGMKNIQCEKCGKVSKWKMK